MGFKGSKYTWWNTRIDEEHIFKRLDRVLCNDKMNSLYPVVEIEHLLSRGSYHASLLINLRSQDENMTKLFRFLNLWVKKEFFK